VDANRAAENVQNCVLGFSDQVPWWGWKQLYTEEEFQKKGKSAGGLQEMPLQKRGWDNEQAAKWRITVELRQVILNYFAEGADPVGVMGRTLIVVPGVHCRLSNIDDAGCWKKTEKFFVGKKRIVRRAGTSAGNCMRAWRDLRLKCPELFADVSIMQQPAAVVDSVITTWSLQELAVQYPCSVWQRDLSGGGGFSLEARKAMSLSSQISCWVAGKMTPVLQITDTDFSYRLKSFALEAKRSMRKQLESKALKDGVDVTLKCGCYEILKIIVDSLSELKRVCDAERLVLSAARRNGLLAWRPDMKARKFVPCSEQGWCADLPQCGASHRLKTSWVEDRMKWLDADGVPLEPAWSDSTSTKVMEDQCDLEALVGSEDVKHLSHVDDLKGPEVAVGGSKYEMLQILLPEFGDVDAALESDFARAAYLQTSPVERLLQQKLDAELSSQKVEATKVKSKSLEKAVRGKATTAFLKNWRKEQLGFMTKDGKSAEELFEELVPAAGVTVDDPAKKVLKEFAALQKSLEVQMSTRDCKPRQPGRVKVQMVNPRRSCRQGKPLQGGSLC
jgi:hypothetical protein